MRGFARFVAILLALAIVASGAFAQSAPAPAKGKSEIVVVYWSSDN